jgi:hypothetical protein
MKFEIKSTSKSKAAYLINIIYFGLLFLQMIVDFFELNAASFIFRIAMPVLLVALYHIHSAKKNLLFYVAMILLLISNLFFFYADKILFFYGILTFILLRAVMIIHIFRLTSDKNYLHIFVGSFPFLVIFFYLISATSEISNTEFNILIIQSILISILGGISVVNYFKNENRQHSWLLISTLLFIGLRFIVFIERYFAYSLSLTIYRPIEILLSVFAFYTFYKYVVTAESNENKNEIIN